MEFDNISLIEIFKNEAESQGLLFEQALLGLLENPENAAYLESAMRAAHSLKGAAQIMGAKGISLIAHHIEDCFVAAQKTGTLLKRVDLSLLLRVFELLVKVKDCSEAEIINWPGTQKREVDALDASLQQLIAQLHHDSQTSYDERFLSLFHKEFRANLSKLSILLREDTPPSFDDTLIRIPHSIKGAAGIVGFVRLAKLCEAIESWFLGLKEGLWVWDMAANKLIQEILSVFQAIATAPSIQMGSVVLKLDSRLSQLTSFITSLCSPAEKESKKKS